mmetsp:Transcript_121299/g.210859  ORF Transcript_121299/g.210859 Transcript_121299/m.210859 type:complete len:81 (+) Transcript_121299:107-349(+)
MLFSALGAQIGRDWVGNHHDATLWGQLSPYQKPFSPQTGLLTMTAAAFVLPHSAGLGMGGDGHINPSAHADQATRSSFTC